MSAADSGFLGALAILSRARVELLRSKELAGWPKDVAFFQLFAARLRQEAGED